MFSAWAWVFGYLLLDDALSIHEKFGKRVGRLLILLFPALATHRALGEVVVLLIFGLFLLARVRAAYRQSDADGRALCWRLATFIAALSVFGGGVDVLHAILGKQHPWADTLTLIEDGGELFVMSAACWFVYRRCLSGPAGQSSVMVPRARVRDLSSEPYRSPETFNSFRTVLPSPSVCSAMRPARTFSARVRTRPRKRTPVSSASTRIVLGSFSLAVSAVLTRNPSRPW
jgi:hypothetical protein